MKQRRKYWSLLVKPTHDCNLNCKYCYDEPMRKKYAGCRMSYEMVDHILKIATDHAEEVSWIWHGGEPMLMGTEWYKGVQEIFYKYADKSKITQSMQSNGILLNKDWAKLNKKYEIDIGVSYDALSQETRFEDKQSSVKENIQEYMKCGGSCGTITVVNKNNYKKMIEIYNHYKNELKISFSFNEVFVTEKSIENDLNLGYEEFATEFRRFFKYWLYDTDNPVQERTVLTFFDLIMGRKNKLCSYSDCRHNWISVNPVGVIYPCDRYVPQVYEMGNIMDYNSVEEIYNALGHKRYCSEIDDRMKNHCLECGYLEYCKGGCNANHIAVVGNASGIDYSYCESFRQKFNIMYELLRDIDIYNEQFNPEIIKPILQAPFFTAKEIFGVLKAELGVNPEDIIYRKSEETKFIDSVEFSLFKIFNKHNDNELSEEEFWRPSIKVDIKTSSLEGRRALEEERLRAIKTILIRNLDDIRYYMSLIKK